MRTSMHCCMLCQLESWLRFSVRDMSNSACFLISLISPPFRSLRLPLLVIVITCPVFKPGVYYEKRERGGAGGRGITLFALRDDALADGHSWTGTTTFCITRSMSRAFSKIPALDKANCSELRALRMSEVTSNERSCPSFAFSSRGVRWRDGCKTRVTCN